VFFREIGRELAKTHRVIYWDYRAHGSSDPAPDGESYSIRDHARDLEAVVEALTRQPPLMIGFSMGVQVIVEWARQWGAAAPGFVFLLGTPRNPLRQHSIFGRKTLQKGARTLLASGASAFMPFIHPFTKAALRSDLAYLVALSWRWISPAFTREDFDEFIRFSSAVPPDAWLRTGLGVLEHDAMDAWVDLHAPTLYVAGEEDLIVPARECAAASHLLSNVTYDELAGRSHAGTVEAGMALASRVRAFVAEVGRSAAAEGPRETLAYDGPPVPAPSPRTSHGLKDLPATSLASPA
jgi:pimeloyl-ACP methyl ester carboxylesterase